MNPFAQSRSQKSGPRADTDWQPPHMHGIMLKKRTRPLSEVFSNAIVWSAEAAVVTRRTRAAVYPPAPYRDATWSVMLHLLFEETRDNPVTVRSLAGLDDVLPGKAAFWAEIMDRLGLIQQMESCGETLVWLTSPARQVVLELLLEPSTWNGPLLTQNITVSHLWQLTRSYGCLD